MVETQNTSDTKFPGAEDVKAASSRVEQKAREMYDVLIDASVKWVGYGLGYGRNAFTTSARALDRVAELIASLEEKLQKKAPEGDVVVDAEAPPATPDPAAN